MIGGFVTVQQNLTGVRCHRDMVTTLRLIGAMLLLAGLDAAAATMLKEATVRRSPSFAVSGILLMVVVAGVLLYTLELAELTIVSLGWIILFQLVVMVIDRFRYHVVPGRVQLGAIVVALVALAVAATAPSQKPEPPMVKGKHVAKSIPRPRPAAWSGPVRQPTILPLPNPRRPSMEERLHQYMAAKRANGGETPYSY